MNAGLQCILANLGIRQYFVDLDLNLTNNDRTLLKSFSDLVFLFNSDSDKIIVPANFKAILTRTHPQFSGSLQQDCHEFLALLLESLNEQLIQCDPIASPSVILRTFQGCYKVQPI